MKRKNRKRSWSIPEICVVFYAIFAGILIFFPWLVTMPGERRRYKRSALAAAGLPYSWRITRNTCYRVCEALAQRAAATPESGATSDAGSGEVPQIVIGDRLAYLRLGEEVILFMEEGEHVVVSESAWDITYMDDDIPCASYWLEQMRERLRPEDKERYCRVLVGREERERSPYLTDRFWDSPRFLREEALGL